MKALRALVRAARAFTGWWDEVSGAAGLRREAGALQAAHLAHAGEALPEAEAYRLALQRRHRGDRPRCC